MSAPHPRILSVIPGRGLSFDAPRSPPGTVIEGRDVTHYHFPLINHARQHLEPQVRVGDSVAIGDVLAPGLISSVQGTVESLASRSFAHPSNAAVPTVTVRASARPPGDTAIPSGHAPPASTSLTLRQLSDCAVNGLGGAGFSTAEKLAAIETRRIHTLIINAVECDPAIRCDEALTLSEADAIVYGIGQLRALTRCQRCLVAVERDKSEMITALRQALGRLDGGDDDVRIELRLIEPIYPSGAERVLVRQVCGQDVIPPQRPADVGILCVNVATAHAAGEAARGKVLTHRIVTVAGPALQNEQNVRVRLGTPLSALIAQCGVAHDPDRHRLTVGGCVSGFELHDADAPVTATTNALFLEPDDARPVAMPCIRCGACSDVCPVTLLPQQLYWHLKADDLDQAVRQGLDRCIECACCDAVCPSGIELTNLFRYGRGERRRLALEQHEAELAQRRHESHMQRQALRDARKQAEILARKEALHDRKSAASDVLERIRRRRNRPAP